MNALLILDDPLYGTERCYNGLRLVHALVQALFQTAPMLVMTVLADFTTSGANV